MKNAHLYESLFVLCFPIFHWQLLNDFPDQHQCQMYNLIFVIIIIMNIVVFLDLCD